MLWNMTKGHSLGSDLDKLLEKLHSFAEMRAQTNLCDHPQLDLIEPPQEQIQVGCRPLEVLPPESVIDEFMLLEHHMHTKRTQMSYCTVQHQMGKRYSSLNVLSFFFIPHVHSQKAPSHKG